MRSGLHSFPFFKIFMILFLLVRLAFMVTSTGLWHRPPDNSTSMRDVRAKPKAGIRFNVQKQPMPDFDGSPWQRSLAWDTTAEGHQGSWKSAKGASTSYTDSRKKGSCGDVPDVLQSTASSPSSSSTGALPKISDQLRSITFNGFVLNMVEGHYLQLRPIHCYSIILTGLTLSLLWLIIPWSRRGGWAICWTINWWCWLLLNCICCPLAQLNNTRVHKLQDQLYLNSSF